MSIGSRRRRQTITVACDGRNLNKNRGSPSLSLALTLIELVRAPSGFIAVGPPSVYGVAANGPLRNFYGTSVTSAYMKARFLHLNIVRLL